MNTTKKLQQANPTSGLSFAKNNPKVKVTAYDATVNTAVAEKPDRPFSMVNDGVKSTANYLELTDTSDSQNHSRYVQFDLGDE